MMLPRGFVTNLSHLRLPSDSNDATNVTSLDNHLLYMQQDNLIAKHPATMFAYSAISILAVTSTVSSLTFPRLSSQSPMLHATRTPRSVNSLHLENRNDNMSEYGREKFQSELSSLQSKRDQLKRQQLANIKPDDDKPNSQDIENMTKKEFDEFVASMGKEDMEGNVNKMLDGDFSAAQWKTKRGPSTQRGVSGPIPEDKEGEEVEESLTFMDWTDESDDDNELHIPNRIGFSTVDWGNEKKGFVNGKLKKKDRKEGKFNEADLKKAYTTLQQSGITFVETSESFASSESILSKFQEFDQVERPLIVSTFPNPWKHAFRSRTRPRYGSKAIATTAEKCCENLGVSSMSLFQVQNPWYYIGGTSALAQGMLEVIQDDHSRYVGCVDMSISKLLRLQNILKTDGEFIATNQFEFSLTNRQNVGMIQQCKKLGIIPICRNVLDGGLATGKYTSTNPTGGEVSKGENDTGPYPLRKLEKLDAIFRTLESLSESVSKRIGSDLLRYDTNSRPNINTGITSTQIAINYVRALGAVPLLSITNPRAANELIGCLGWDLNEDEVEELDKACRSCGL